MIEHAQDHDPGPLDDRALRRTLCDPRYARASKTHDRVQDAVGRLIAARDLAVRTAIDASEEMTRDAELVEDLLEQLVETRKERWYAAFGGVAIGTACTLALHTLGWWS